MTDRQCRPDRRPCNTVGIIHHGTRYDGTVGTYINGALGEVLIEGAKGGSEVSHLIHDIAALISIAVQYQVPVQVMAGAVARINTIGTAHTIAGAVLDVLAEERAQ